MVKGDSRVDALETRLSTLEKEVERIAVDLSRQLEGLVDQFNTRMTRIETLLKQLVNDKGIDHAESSCVAGYHQESTHVVSYERSSPKPTQAKLELPLRVTTLLLG